MQYYDITVAAAGRAEISAAGTYMRYLEGSAGGADTTITVRGDTSGTQILLKPGQSIRLPETVNRWYIGNYRNAATITGIVVIGYGALEDDRVTGEVSVISGEISRTLAGLAFISPVSQPGVAGQYSKIQLWNPAGSGKNVVLNKFTGYTSPTNVIAFTQELAPETTLYSYGKNKRRGGTDSIAEIRNGTAVSTPAGLWLSFMGPPAMYVSADHGFSEPIILPPGYGITGYANAVNVTVAGVFQFIEQPI